MEEIEQMNQIFSQYLILKPGTEIYIKAEIESAAIDRSNCVLYNAKIGDVDNVIKNRFTDNRPIIEGLHMYDILINPLCTFSDEELEKELLSRHQLRETGI